MGRADHDRSPIQERTNELARQKPPWKQTVSRKGPASQYNHSIGSFYPGSKVNDQGWGCNSIIERQTTTVKTFHCKSWRMNEKQEAPLQNKLINLRGNKDRSTMTDVQYLKTQYICFVHWINTQTARPKLLHYNYTLIKLPLS